MKEKIIEIIKRNLNHLSIQQRTSKTIATEIESFIKENYVEKEFTMWLGKQIQFGLLSMTIPLKYIYNGKLYFFDELREYWQTNIKDK